MMLEYLDQKEKANQIRHAIYDALEDPALRTGDLGGEGSTESFTDAIIERL
jgi:isocitrate dehydrogenase (NAD+)